LLQIVCSMTASSTGDLKADNEVMNSDPLSKLNSTESTAVAVARSDALTNRDAWDEERPPGRPLECIVRLVDGARKHSISVDGTLSEAAMFETVAAESVPTKDSVIMRDLAECCLAPLGNHDTQRSTTIHNTIALFKAIECEVGEASFEVLLL
jgi:hypothetical protein